MSGRQERNISNTIGNLLLAVDALKTEKQNIKVLFWALWAVT